MKLILSGVLAVAGLAAIGWAVLEAPPARAAAERGPLRPIELRPFPGAPPAARAPAVPVPDEEPEPLRPLTPVDAGTPAAPAADAGVAVPRPGPAAPGPAAPPGAPRPPPAAAGEGTLSLTASDTADIYLDGKKVGSSPMRGLKVRAGPHKVRFDCYDAAGNSVSGTVKLVTVVADQEQAITYPCPESQ